MNEREFALEWRRLLLAQVAAIEKRWNVHPTSAELRHKGEEYLKLLTQGSLYSPDEH